MTPACTTDFDDWLVDTFGRVGSFTMLIVLVDIGETSISLLASSYLHVIGNETRWTDMMDLLSSAGVPWSGFQVRGGKDFLLHERYPPRFAGAISISWTPRSGYLFLCFHSRAGGGRFPALKAAAARSGRNDFPRPPDKPVRRKQ